MPNVGAMWVPPAADNARRSEPDPDVTPGRLPHLAYHQCNDPIRSAGQGDSAKVYVANLFDGPIQIRRLKPGKGYTKHDVERDPALDVDAFTQSAQLRPTYVELEAQVGDVFAAWHQDGNAWRCLGKWEVLPHPPRAVLPYSVFEVHGDNGILPRLAREAP